jgi:hypothetical protein
MVYTLGIGRRGRMAEEKTTKQAAIAVPPYLSFKTFKAFVESLKVGIPTRIDRTVLSSMSGAVQSQLMAALRYLGMVTAHSVTTVKLASLVNSEGSEYERVLASILQEGYPFLFGGEFDLLRATTGEMEEAFRKSGASGETIRKCVAFFLAAAKSAGLPVSPHIKTSSVTRVQRGAKRQSPLSNSIVAQPHSEDPLMPPVMPMATWSQMLLAKFPSFDPSWPDEVKTKWFESFEKLMRSEGKV